jgi:uncharacterized membrane protein YfcA
MNQFLVESILGLLAGLFLGVTGIAPVGLILIALELLKIGDYKTNLGSVLFLNLFPISIGSVYQFYKEKKINFSLGIILTISVMIGSYISSAIFLDKEKNISPKMLKYITSALGFSIGIIYFTSAYYHDSNI